MKVNIEFLVIAYFISLFIDWVFQSQWQAINKSKWETGNYFNAFSAVWSHSLIYSLLTTLGLRLFNIIKQSQFGLVALVLLISHMIIDTRILVKWIMRLKGISWNDIETNKDLSFIHIGIDHRLHEMVLLILALFI